MTAKVMVCGMSRTGTTLMATILDAHPRVSMGYELLSPGLPSTTETLSLLQGCAHLHDPRAAAAHLTGIGHDPVGRLVRRAWRATVGVTQLRGILTQMVADGVGDLDDVAAQAMLCSAIVQVKADAEGADLAGYKLNTPAVADYIPHLHDPRLVCMTRDPRDVLASHQANAFGKSPDQVARAWEAYERRYAELVGQVGERARIVRYEDLVSDGPAVVADVAGWLGLPDPEPMVSFTTSKASVYRGGHVNDTQLRRDFFTTSIGRWTAELDRTEIAAAQRPLDEAPGRPPYPAVDLSGGVALGPDVLRANRARLRPRVKFHRADYERLLAPWIEDRDVLTLTEAMGHDVVGRERITYIRHDIDHDLESAVEIGEWEHRQGIRSTFCVLHTTWYYGEFVDGAYTHGREMLDAMRHLQSLGHEINLHNNMVTQALLHGPDPDDLLAAELAFLRLEGLDIRGTSTHGDALCREVGYFNLEQFRETPWHSNGGRRLVHHEGRTVELGRRPMAAFGLEYEAYDLPRDLYITDSGGRPRIVKHTRGRNGLRRAEMSWDLPHGHIVGILTHPVYWDVTTDDLGLDGYPDMAQLEAEYEQRRLESKARARSTS